MIKLKSLGSIAAAAIAIGTATLPQPSQAQTSGSTFFCGMNLGNPATLVRTVRGNMPLINWTSQDFIASGWPPERRCKAISARFERLNSRGQLKYMVTGRVNGQPVICGSTTRSGGCSSDRVLVTIPPGKDANQTLDRLLNTRVGASSTPIYLSPEDDKAIKLTYDQNGNASVEVDAILGKLF